MSQTSRVLIGAVNRNAALVRWISGAAIVISLWLIVGRLPIGRRLEALQDGVGRLGVWGPVVYGLIYVAAVVALVPGSALTIAAGAMFGLVAGTITASIAATTGAALAFLIARYLAREQVARLVRRDPRFEAIDRAISRNDWKIIMLLRLSPAVPFNLQNYLYGLTGARFWPAMLVSWLAMLPATFLFVYLGHAGRAGLEAAVGDAQRARTPAEWSLIGVGLPATVAVTIYLSRLARRALREGTAIDQPAVARSRSQPRVEPAGWPWGTMVAMAIALGLLFLAVLVHIKPELLPHLFGGLLGLRPILLLRGENEELGPSGLELPADPESPGAASDPSRACQAASCFRRR